MLTGDCTTGVESYATNPPNRGRTFLRSPLVGRRLDVDQLVGVTEIAHRLGAKTAGRVHDWRRRYPDFPAPVASLKMGLVWSCSIRVRRSKRRRSGEGSRRRLQAEHAEQAPGRPAGAAVDGLADQATADPGRVA